MWSHRTAQRNLHKLQKATTTLTRGQHIKQFKNQIHNSRPQTHLLSDLNLQELPQEVMSEIISNPLPTLPKLAVNSSTWSAFGKALMIALIQATERNWDWLFALLQLILWRPPSALHIKSSAGRPIRNYSLQYHNLHNSQTSTKPALQRQNYFICKQYFSNWQPTRYQTRSCRNWRETADL